MTTTTTAPKARKAKLTHITIAALENRIMEIEDVLVVFRVKPTRILKLRAPGVYFRGGKIRAAKTVRGLTARLAPYLEALGGSGIDFKIIPKSEIPMPAAGK